MSIREAADAVSIRALLDYLNLCHDASLRRITFMKKREFDAAGDLVYPFTDMKDAVKCDIEIELLLNSYRDALPEQIVLLYFMAVQSFRFCQQETYDYSDIRQVDFRPSQTGMFEFCFSATQKEIKVLTLVCSKLVCEERGGSSE